MKFRSAVLLLACHLAAALCMAGPARQWSRDTTAAALGVIIHGPRVGRVDSHVDVFGGANWPNDTDLLLTEMVFIQFAGPPRGDRARFDNRKMHHTVAPHGEAPIPNAIFGIWVDGAQGGNQNVRSSSRQRFVHRNHFDDVRQAAVGASNNFRFSSVAGVLIAVHRIPEEFAFIEYGHLRPESRAKGKPEAAGLVALVVDGESKTVLFGVGIPGTELGALKEVTVRAGTPDDPGPTLMELSGDEIIHDDDLGAGGVFERLVDLERIEAVEKSGAYAEVRTSTVPLVAQLDGFAAEERASRVPPFCRATVPVRIQIGRLGPSADACKKTIAMAEAFDAASNDLCAAAECRGGCRIEGSTCKPQIPLLPDRRDFACQPMELEECAEGRGWRCFWQAPQWFSCDCACRR